MNEITNSINALLPASSERISPRQTSKLGDASFLDAMKQVLTTTSQLQSESSRLSREITLENPTISLEQTMHAAVKSNIAFQATLQTRNRIVQAYTDIMNMQV
jgi:flagellar hook-basal body complex protein FliE